VGLQKKIKNALTRRWLVGIWPNSTWYGGTSNHDNLLRGGIKGKIIKAMAHPTRMMTIEFLRGGERPFTAMFRLFQLDKSTISKHLLVLKESGIISSRKTGREIIYKLDVPCVADFFACAQ